MFADSLTYPHNGIDAVKTILIGGLLTVFGFLLVPLFMVAGYTVRVVRDVAAGEDETPAFDRWGELLVDGIKAIVITIVYAVVPMVVFVGAVGLAVFPFDAGPQTGLLLGGVALLGLLVAGVLALICWYVATAEFVNFATTGRLGAAFAVGDLRAVLTCSSFVTAWVIALGVLVGSNIGSGMLEIMPFGLGYVLSAFVAFVAAVSMSYLYARGSADATAVDPAPVQPSGQPAV